MKLGMGWALMNGGRRPDHEVYEDALELLELAEPAGFDSLWTVEHHFTGHSPVPDALQMLTWAAARTRHIELGAAVVVPPWHDPLRLAEQIAMLDILSRGRTRIGFGRGSSRVEYDGLGVAQDEGHGRLQESIRFISEALQAKQFTFKGDFYSCGGVTVRPSPVHRPEQHFYCAAHSAASASIAGAAGLRLLFSPETDQEFTRGVLAAYHSAAEANGREVGGSSIHLYVSVSHDREEAVTRARRYMASMINTLASHYGARIGEIISPAAVVAGADLEKATDAFIAKHIVGTPDECIEKITALQDAYRFEQFIGEFSYGDMPMDEVRSNVSIFSTDVMPTLRGAAEVHAQLS